MKAAEGAISATDLLSGLTFSFPIPHDGRTFVVSVGKAAANMYSAARSVLDTAIDGKVQGAVLTNAPKAGIDLPDTLWLQGNHPFPDRTDIDNARKVHDLLSGAAKGDLVLFLLSGGASSLLFSPRHSVDPVLKTDIVRRLMLGGADIRSLNTVRTYLSDVKGGGLLRWTGEADVLSLILSDVMGDDLRFVGSGPTVPYEPAVEEVLGILTSYHLDDPTISKVVAVPRRDLGTVRSRYHNVLMANNDSALDIAAGEIDRLGLKTFIDRRKYSGEARMAGPSVLSDARAVTEAGIYDCYVRGGETTVTVRGRGRGGRNLEMALSIVPHLHEDEIAVCLATDGADGSSGSAGAIVGSETGPADLIARSLERNDSAGFFEGRPGLVRTGPTGQNLGDIFILLRRPRGPPTSSPGPRLPGGRT